MQSFRGAKLSPIYVISLILNFLFPISLILNFLFPISYIIDIKFLIFFQPIIIQNYDVNLHWYYTSCTGVTLLSTPLLSANQNQVIYLSRILCVRAFRVGILGHLRLKTTTLTRSVARSILDLVRIRKFWPEQPTSFPGPFPVFFAWKNQGKVFFFLKLGKRP